MSDENDPLFPRSRVVVRKKNCFVAVLVVTIVLVCMGLCVFFLFPRDPVVVVDEVGFPGGGAPNVVSLNPPVFSVPISLMVNVSNPNFFAIKVVDPSTIWAVFESKSTGNTSLGISLLDEIEVESQSLNKTLVLNVQLLYSFFKSPAVLAEIFADCSLKGRFLVKINANMVLDVLFLEDFPFSTTVPVNISCTVA